MQDKYEINSKTSLDNEIEENNKTITGLILKLKRSTKAFTVLQDQNKELQRHVDALIKLDMDNNKDVVEMFENYQHYRRSMFNRLIISWKMAFPMLRCFISVADILDVIGKIICQKVKLK